MTPYEKKIVRAFRDLCEKQKNGASPAEVTTLLAERFELSELDTVIDIADIMKSLRDRGYL